MLCVASLPPQVVTVALQALQAPSLTLRVSCLASLKTLRSCKPLSTCHCKVSKIRDAYVQENEFHSDVIVEE